MFWNRAKSVEKGAAYLSKRSRGIHHARTYARAMTLRIFKLGCFLVAARAAGGSPVRLAPPLPPSARLSPRSHLLTSRLHSGPKGREGRSHRAARRHDRSTERLRASPARPRRPPRPPRRTRNPTPAAPFHPRRRLSRGRGDRRAAAVVARLARREDLPHPPPKRRRARHPARCHERSRRDRGVRAVVRLPLRRSGPVGGGRARSRAPRRVGDGAQAPSQDLPEPGHGRRRRC